MRTLILLLGTLVLGSFPLLSQTDFRTSARPDGHAPIGVLGDHLHGRGDLMLSYRFMTMEMNGLLEGDDPVSIDVVLERYPVVPRHMRMQMHMLGAMYSLSDRLTLMAMVPYLDNRMDLHTWMGVDFTTASGGLGDVSVSALIKLITKDRRSLHVTVG
ncbi:hypothetical protein [Neolewinella sp.]|uniref:hypothetical protein n=1 Tax=Neolewinella sp. TaxID=2993543 RepID=UPI003B529A6C